MNPIIFRQGVCDPHVHIFEGKAYLYATKDDPGHTSGFHMTEWQIWSSEDLIDWTLERRIFPKDFYCGETDQCWATDAACRNGKYYWYFSRGAEETGVGVSDRPAGPFSDALGKALFDARTEPENISKWDPCCFVDDDGSAYLIVGCTRFPPPNDKYLIARLNEDMISPAEALRRIEYIGNPCDEDKVTIHKRNGRYYLSHASYYAVADNVYGPYVHRGNFAANNDHGSFFTYHNQEYNASGGMDNPSQYYRSSYLYYVHYKDNGDIVVDKQIGQYGVGQYDACWDRIEAEWYFAAEGVSKREKSAGGFEIRDIHRGDSLYFQNINNVERNARITFTASCRNPSGGEIVLYDGQGGRRLGSLWITDTGGWEEYRTFSTVLENEPGTLQLYLEFQGGEGELLRLDSFFFGERSDYRQCSEGYMGVQEGNVKTIWDKRANGHRKTGGFRERGDCLTLCCDGGEDAELTIRYWNEAEDAFLTLYVNGRHAGRLFFPKSEGKAGELTLSPALRKGINRIAFRTEEGDRAAELYVDCVITRRRRSIERSYAAGGADYFPRGNGCWDGLPQTENDPYAFSGRLLNYLIQNGCGFELEGVEGEGAQAVLAFRYASKSDSRFELLVNGEPSDEVYFRATGSDYMDQADTTGVKAFLQKGANRISLVKRGADGRLNLDAVTVQKL